MNEARTSWERNKKEMVKSFTKQLCSEAAMTAPIRNSSSLSSQSTFRKDSHDKKLKSLEPPTVESDVSTRMDEASVRTHPVTHEVNINLLGIAGITFDQRKGSDKRSDGVAPPPQDVKAIVTLREMGNSARDFRVKSEWSGHLKQSEDETSTNVPASSGTTRCLALWNSSNALPGAPLSFESQMEVDENGTVQKKSFEVVLSLADTTSTDKELVLVPIGSSVLTLEGTASRAVCDLAVENTRGSSSHLYPVERVDNPNHVKKAKAPKPAPERIKPKRKFGFFKRRNHRQQLKEDTTDSIEEEKKEDDEGETPFTDLSSIYTIDETGDAVLRVELDWKMKDPEMELNMEKTLTRGRGLIQARNHQPKPILRSPRSRTASSRITTPTFFPEEENVDELTGEKDEFDLDGPVHEPVHDQNDSGGGQIVTNPGCAAPYFEGMWEANWGFEWGSKSETKSNPAAPASGEEVIHFGTADEPETGLLQALDQGLSRTHDADEEELRAVVERLLTISAKEKTTPPNEPVVRNDSMDTDGVKVVGRASPHSKTIVSDNHDDELEAVERVLSWDRSIRSKSSKSPRSMLDNAESMIERAVSWGERSARSLGGNSERPSETEYYSKPVKQAISWEEKSIKSQKSQSSRVKERQTSPVKESRVEVQATSEVKTDTSMHESVSRAPSPIRVRNRRGSGDNNESTVSKSSRPTSVVDQEIPQKSPSQVPSSSASVVSSSSSMNQAKSTTSSSAKSKRTAAFVRRLSRSRSYQSETPSSSDVPGLGSLSLSRSASQDALCRNELHHMPLYTMAAVAPSVHSVQSQSLRGEEIVSEVGTNVESYVDLSSRAPTSVVSQEQKAASVIENASVEQTESQLELVLSKSDISHTPSTTIKSETTYSRSDFGNEAAIQAMSEAARLALNTSASHEEKFSETNEQVGNDKLKRKMFVLPSRQGPKRGQKTKGDTGHEENSISSGVEESKESTLSPTHPYSSRSSPATVAGSVSLDNSTRRDGMMSVDGSLKRGGSTVKVSNTAVPSPPPSPPARLAPSTSGAAMSSTEYSNPRLTDDDAFSFSVATTRREYSMRGKRATTSILAGCGVMTHAVDTIARCGEDDDLSWQNTTDDESYVTRSTYNTMQRENGTPLRFGSALLRQCGTTQMADLGDAVVEEGKELRAMWNKYRNNMQGNKEAGAEPDERSLRTGTDFASTVFTGTDAGTSFVSTYDGDKSSKVSLGRKQTRPTSHRTKPRSTESTPSSRKASAHGNSPRSVMDPGVAGAGDKGSERKKARSAVLSLSEGFVNLVTCNRFDADSSSLVDYPVPRELFGDDTERSVGALTVSTYERKFEHVPSNKKEEGALEAEDVMIS